jgi:hypothetical protein
VDDVAWLHGLEKVQVEGMLRWALKHAAQWRLNQFYRLTKVPGTEQPYPERDRVA